MVSSYEEEHYGYKVDLEVFSGPLDLLLYLIRQDEVEIADIPISRITDQYLAHLELMQHINVNVAGEFLVMAATLMEIKSRMLLPRPETTGEEEEEDPRADLIRQLIEYKKFKDAARSLAARAGEQALKFPRGAAAVLGTPERPAPEELPIDLGEVTIWELLAAFKVILSQTSLDTTRHILLDERPATAYCNDLLDELRSCSTATLRELFDPAAGRLALINAFLALLELIRRRRVRAEQAGHHGEIRIVLLDDTPVSESELVTPQAPAEPSPAAEGEAAPPAEGPAPEPLPAAQAPLDEEEIEEFADLDLPDIETIPEPTLDLSEEGAAKHAASCPPPAPQAPVGGASVPRVPRAGKRRVKKPTPKPWLLRRRRIPSLLARLARCRPVPSTRGPVGVVARKPRC
ncbi:MAG TPA: segregation/condensation protein A [Planctomycetota bacterium]|nr:segregation/condensation protein A [Planctomycetota bacterium]